MKTLGQGLRIGLLALLASLTAAWADSGPEIKMASFEASQTLGTMDLKFSLSLDDSLRHALEGGTELTFVAEMRIMESGFFLSREVQHYSWLAKLRRASFGQGYEYRGFSSSAWRPATSVQKALQGMSYLRLEFRDKTFLRNLRSNADLFFSHRVELVLDNLPDPLQVDLLTSSDWSFSSGWQHSQP